MEDNSDVYEIRINCKVLKKVFKITYFHVTIIIGCNHALFTLRKTIDHFVGNNSTVNLCTLDMSKAFDRLNHSL